MDAAAVTAQSDTDEMISADEAAVLADVRAAVAGDGAAYARLIRRYQQPISRRMRHFARGAAELEEMVHDVFVEAYFGLGRFRAEADFSHWLMRIATRVGYRSFKRRRRDSDRRDALQSSTLGQVEAIDSTGVGAAAEAEESAQQLSALLEKLPPRDRLVVTLMYVEGRSVEEAARLTGWSQTMVKVQAFRARGKLRKLLGK